MDDLRCPYCNGWGSITDDCYSHWSCTWCNGTGRRQVIKEAVEAAYLGILKTNTVGYAKPKPTKVEVLRPEDV